MPRILVVSQHYWPENFRVTDLCEGFVSRGVEVDVLCGLPNYPLGNWFPGYSYTGPRRETRNGVQLIRAGEIPRKGNSGPMIFLNYVSWPLLALFSLPRLKGKYDAVLCYNTSPVLMSFPAILYAKLRRVPLTNYVLDIWPENLYSVLNIQSRPLRAIAQAVSNWHYRRADRLIAMSDSLRRRLAQVGKKPEEEIAVIPQYCEDFYARPADPSALQKELGEAFWLVFTGNFSPAQSLETVIRAVCIARQQGLANLRLLLVGDGMSRPALEKLVQEEGAGDFITFYGSVPPTRIPEFCALASGLVCPLSDSPDLGMTVPAKLASYMASGRPVLASITGEGAKAVENAQCGYASPACNAEALAENIVRLCHVPEEERRQMGENARRWYREHYRRDRLLEQLLRFTLEGRTG